VKLDERAREVVRGAIAGAHDDLGAGKPSRQIAARVIELLRDSERFGHVFVDAYLDDLAVGGMMKVCADWRRAHSSQGRTAKGTPVPVPTYTATADDDGNTVQASFADLDLGSLRDQRASLAATRDTYSKRIRMVSDLIEIMEADAAVKTVGDALHVLNGAA
jgi:hypothetical protein